MEENKNSKKKVGIIIAIVVGVFLILGLVLFFVLSGKKVTITFDSDGGTAVEVIKIKKGSTITLPESEKEGFTLEGWYIDEQKVTSDTTFNKNTTLKARWTTSKPKSFKVTFDSREGSEVEPLEVECNKELKLPENPTKEGYVFISWVDKNETPILDGALLSCEDVTLYANWQKKEEAKKYYTVKFDSKGGSNINSIQVECNTKLKLPATKPTRTGYEFVSWYDKNGKTILDGALLTCEDITLFADWKKIDETKEKKYYTITFNSNGGSSVPSRKYECDKPIDSLPTPTRSGYTFLVWSDSHGKVIIAGAILGCSGTNDVVTLYADWTQDKPSTPEKQYKCPSGYTLSGTKCTIEGTIKEKCPDGTKVDGTLCIKTSDSNAGTRVCKSDTVAIDGKGHTWTGKGDYYFYSNSYGKCAYYKWENYDTQSKCDQARDIYHSTTWVNELKGCYAATKMNNYETVCASDYQWYSSSDLSSKFGIHDNGKCLKKVEKTKYCDDGYTLTNGKCVKTINATYE